MRLVQQYRERAALRAARGVLEMDRPRTSDARWSTEDWQWALRRVGTSSALALAERQRQLAELARRHNPLKVACPECGAQEVEPCIDTGPIYRFHLPRVMVARAGR